MNQNRILAHIKTFAATGWIHDALIPCYDQDGRWRGDTIFRGHTKAEPWLARIRATLLPSWRRTRKTRTGTVLQTSFWWSGPEPVVVRYPRIEGSFIVTHRDAPILASNLRHLGGHFVTNTRQRVQLPRLESVAGNFEAMHPVRLDAPRLRMVGGRVMLAVPALPPCLEHVGRKLAVFGPDRFEAAHLKRVGGALVLARAGEIQAPVLETVGGGILLSDHARQIKAPRLQSVGGDFLAACATEIRLPALRLVMGTFDTRCAVGFYDPCIEVLGRWSKHPEAVRDWEARQAALRLLKGDGDPLWL